VFDRIGPLYVEVCETLRVVFYGTHQQQNQTDSIYDSSSSITAVFLHAEYMFLQILWVKLVSVGRHPRH
jgi:hypothetical protein